MGGKHRRLLGLSLISRSSYISSHVIILYTTQSKNTVTCLPTYIRGTSSLTAHSNALLQPVYLHNTSRPQRITNHHPKPSKTLLQQPSLSSSASTKRMWQASQWQNKKFLFSVEKKANQQAQKYLHSPSKVPRCPVSSPALISGQ